MDERERQALLRRSAELMEQVDRVNEARSRREEAGQAAWQQPEPKPPPAAERAPQRLQRGPSPPLPDKIQRTVHDERGRITSLETYSGASAQAVGRWECWVRGEIRTSEAKMAEGIGQALGQIRKEIEGDWKRENDRLRSELSDVVTAMHKLSDKLLRLEKGDGDRHLSDDLDRTGLVH